MQTTSKEQVTIPQEVSHQRGPLPDEEIVIEWSGGGHEPVRYIIPKRSGNSRMRMSLERARGSGDVPLSTDEIMAMTRGED